MDHLGHGLALQHDIFRKPNPVTFEWVERDRPDHYAEGETSPLYPQGVPAKYRLAKFEEQKPAGWNPTIVSHEGFFTDVPGFENLAEGNSAKMLGSLSLARQGRYFYWGYSADPDEMTAGAEDTLVNVLHYMRGRRGEQTVPFVCKTRKILWVYTVLGKEKGYLRGVEEHFPNQLTERWRETYTPTFEGAGQWVAKYLPFVFSGRGEPHRHGRYSTVFEVDEDALALGTPNGQRASLERWLALADGGEGSEQDRERAVRCLRRYVHPDLFPDLDATTWREWYRRHRERLVFVDSAGFWWMLDPNAK
ncbi:MAG: hypothetical protein KAI24_12815 [Planctomycetes bacterium]|nr:hypothetical protein [Planctomycetota bacterium]